MIGLYALGIILLWLWLTWLLLRFSWRNLERGKNGRNVTISLVILIWFVASFWFGGGQKYYYDWQVDQMCAKDGGIRVFETVELPAEYFNQWGQPNFYDPTGGEYALGKEYIYKMKKTFYRDKAPTVSKREYRVFRRDDGKLLGESVSYVRGGGDIPGPWHPSLFRCPKEGGVIPLFVKIFQQSEIK